MRLSYEGDLTEAQEWLGKAQQELFRLRERMGVSGREQGVFQHALSDTAYAYGGIIPGGIEWVHIVTSPGATTSTGGPLYKPTTPDFISGVAVNNRILDPDSPTQVPRLQGFYPTPASVRMHPKELPSPVLSKPARLAVDTAPTFSDLQGQTPVHYAQTQWVRPTMYSGTMRKVVQALLGFGKQQGVKVHDKLFSIYDLAKPHLAAEKATSEKPTLTKWQQSVAKDGLKVWYDCRFSRTHGITKGADGKLWLVEISSGRGVVAMPLPVWPITATPEFRAKVEAMGDDEAVTMLDELHGFPTGEHFPTVTAEFDAYVRAGRIVHILPASALADFYGNQMYSTLCGWAFNSTGSEAHNTAYNYNGPNGCQIGVHYAMNLQLGTIHDPDAGASDLAKADRKARRAAIKALIAPLRNDAEFADTFEAAYWKCDYLTESNLLTVEAEIGGRKDKLRALDALVLTPLGAGTASLGLMGQGYLWSDAKPLGQPQIKFPEPALGSLYSHDFRPDLSRWDAHYHDPQFCDTTMYVFFKGDLLVPVKFYFQPVVHTDPVTVSDEEPCMWIGKWTKTVTTGQRYIPAGFYTSEFDDRHEVAETVTVDATDSTFLGMRGIGFTDYPWWPSMGRAGRSWGFAKNLYRTETRSPRWQNSITIPFGDREAYYYAYSTSHQGISHLHAWRLDMLLDPWSGEYDRYFPGFARKDDQYRGGCGVIGDHRKTFNQRHLIEDPCQEIVDYGPWPPICTDIDVIAFVWDRITEEGPGTSTVWSELPRFTLRVTHSCSDPYDDEHITVQQVVNDSSAGDMTGGLWFYPAPDPDTGDAQYIASTRNALGSGDPRWIEKEINSGKHIWSGSPSLVAEVTSLPTFIGVING